VGFVVGHFFFCSRTVARCKERWEWPRIQKLDFAFKAPIISLYNQILDKSGKELFALVMFGGTPLCTKCTKPVYAAEQVSVNNTPLSSINTV